MAFERHVGLIEVEQIPHAGAAFVVWAGKLTAPRPAKTTRLPPWR